MDRDAWIMAAWMVAKHGADAFRTVEAKLGKMQRDGVDEEQYMHWCWIARAVLEISRAEPCATDAIH